MTSSTIHPHTTSSHRRLTQNGVRCMRDETDESLVRASALRTRLIQNEGVCIATFKINGNKTSKIYVNYLLYREVTKQITNELS